VEDVAPWLLSLCSTHIFELCDSGKIHPRTLQAIQDIRSWFQVGIFAKRTLVLYLMGTVLESAVKGQDPRSALAAVVGAAKIQLISTKNAGNDWHGLESWLGFCDPLEYVSSFYTMLATLSNALATHRQRFKSFRIRSPYVLHGILEDGTFVSVVAYCGGWISDPTNVKCGMAPLVFGSHQTCPECHRLVCEKCGYCHSVCRRCAARQRSVANRESALPDDDVDRLSFSQKPLDDGADTFGSVDDDRPDEYWTALVNEVNRFGSLL
jgi:ferredoxin